MNRSTEDILVVQQLCHCEIFSFPTEETSSPMAVLGKTFRAVMLLVVQPRHVDHRMGGELKSNKI